MNKLVTPEEMKAWIDATWEKCQSEAWKEPRQWQGLTEAEREQATGWSVEHIEAKLKETET